MVKRVIMFGLLILIVTFVSFTSISAVKNVDVDSDSNNDNRTAYESPIPKDEENSEEEFALPIYSLIIAGIVIAGAFSCAIVAVLWAIRKERQNSAYSEMANSNATSKPTGLSNKETALTATSEIDTGSEYHFPSPSDFDRPGQKTNHNPLTQTHLSEYAEFEQFQSERDQCQIQYQNQIYFNEPDTPMKPF